MDLFHIQILFCSPARAGDKLQAHRTQQQSGIAIGEGSDNARPAPDLSYDAIGLVVRIFKHDWGIIWR